MKSVRIAGYIADCGIGLLTGPTEVDLRMCQASQGLMVWARFAGGTL